LSLKGKILGMQGKIQDALKLIDKAIELDPKDPGPYHDRGAIFMGQRDPERALEYFEKSVDVDPNFLGGWVSKGLALSILKRYEEALKCFDKVIEINPNFKEARRMKAMVLRELGRDSEVVDTLDILTSKDPENFDAWINKGIELLRIKHDSEALESFERAIELNSKSGKAWTLKAVALRGLRQVDEAIECFDKAIELDPEDFNGYFEKAQTLVTLRRIDDAVNLCDEALEAIPNSHELLFLKGHLLGLKKDFKQALEYIDKALKIKPDFKPAQEAKKIASEMLKVHPPEEEVKKLLLSNPTDAAGFYNKAYALNSVGDYEKAIEMYDEALKLKPDFIQALHNKGALLGQLKRYDEALECMDDALKISPNDFRILSNKAATLMYLKRNEEALETIEKVLELKPKYADGWINKGSILVGFNKHQEALECYEKAIDINPNYDKAWYNKSVVLKKLGRTEEAEKAKKEAILINPALDKSDIIAMIDGKSFFGKGGGTVSQGEYACDNCGNPVKFGDKYCKKCGTQVGKGGDKVPIIHFGLGGPSIGTMDLKDLKIQNIPKIDKETKLEKPFRVPSMEEMQNFMNLTDQGTSLAQQKRFDEAIELYDKALELMPHAWFTLLMKANVLLQAAKDEEVVEVTNELCHYHPYKSDGWYIRGLALINLGRLDEGWKCLHNALKIDPRMKPAQDTINRLNRTHPNNFKFVLPKLKEPVRRTYKLIYDIFNQVDPNEWISFRVLEFTFAGFVESAVKKEYDMEFIQTDFKEFLPKIVYLIVKQEGFFIAYVGKLAASIKNTLFLGYIDALDGLDRLKLSQSSEGGFKPYPFYEEIVDKYGRIQKEWKEIWDNAIKIPLKFFFNLELLEEFIESLKSEFN
ncbi:MAG: tetratricopeptide repeat protein, partial [Candidatus Hermodarchaeota archaeon]